MKEGLKHKPKDTLIAVLSERLGSLPGCVALECHDIGIATLEDGGCRTITWGANISPDKQAWYQEHTDYKPVWIGAADGSAELIIPGKTAPKLLGILIP